MNRSRTCEYIYSQRQGIETKSAGVSDFALQKVTAELVAWSDIVLCMTERQKAFIEEKFVEIVVDKKVGCLDITDSFEYMDPEFIAVLPIASLCLPMNIFFCDFSESSSR